MKKRSKFVFSLLSIIGINEMQSQNEDPNLYVSIGHGISTTFNPQAKVGLNIVNGKVDVWTGFEYKQSENLQKYTYLAVEHRSYSVDNLYLSYGLEFSTINVKQEVEYYDAERYTGPDTSISIGSNLAVNYQFTKYIHGFINYNVYTAAKYNKFGVENQRITNDFQIGLKLDLFNLK